MFTELEKQPVVIDVSLEAKNIASLDREPRFVSDIMDGLSDKGANVTSFSDLESRFSQLPKIDALVVEPAFYAQNLPMECPWPRGVGLIQELQRILPSTGILIASTYADEYQQALHSDGADLLFLRKLFDFDKAIESVIKLCNYGD